MNYNNSKTTRQLLSYGIHDFILVKGHSTQRGGGPPLLFPNSEKKQNSFKLLNHKNSR